MTSTAGDVYRERIVLGLWEKVPCAWWAKNTWKNAITHVASTTCSVELAKFLIDQGMPVDWGMGKSVPTPLVHAARKTNAKAAELVKLILFNGANDVVETPQGGRNEKNKYILGLSTFKIRISEEKGARQISKWLGVTFEELVAQARKAKGEVKSSDT
ncbi:hypothetical protein DE146DRAFT_764416 [Phaeosphaeria sp. MPI-PUGE-AT-0046c]|nr:hypothetical protein DE146DRAFT_764416 [Phaeosphaeria sp. MPI-PUGE-AT-0046c]